MKVTRILVYEGTEEKVLKQLGNSLPDGIKEFGAPEKNISISVLTYGNIGMLEAYRILEIEEAAE